MKRVANILVLIILAMGCKKPYTPTAIAFPGSYLVVEGVIKAGADSTIIKISRTVSLSSGTTTNPEKNAIVTVQNDANNSYLLTETSSGNYAAAGLNLDVTRKYRLSIKTANNQQYLSDLVAVSITPPIDSIGFVVQANNLQLYVNTHDPNNSTHYYRWDYAEAWQFHAKYYSAYITTGDSIVPRTTNQYIYSCFGNDVSSSIVLGSSAKLKQDVIYQNPLTNIASTSEKIESKYSILVNEYALTGDAYNFWTNLKTNTEQLGSIFDAQPSNINGNIHNVNNAAEPVIGYISACTVQSKRIFISNSQLPISWQPTYPYDCLLDTNFYCRPLGNGCQNDVALYLIPKGSTSIPISAIYNNITQLIIGFLGTSSDCADCTIRGTPIQPPFWK